MVASHVSCSHINVEDSRQSKIRKKSASMERQLGYEVQLLAGELLVFFNFQGKKSQFYL